MWVPDPTVGQNVLAFSQFCCLKMAKTSSEIQLEKVKSSHSGLSQAVWSSISTRNIKLILSTT